MIYNLGTKVQQKNEIRKEKRKKITGGHAVNNTEVRAMMREKCTEKGRHSMPGNIRKNPAYNAGLTDEGGIICRTINATRRKGYVRIEHLAGGAVD